MLVESNKSIFWKTVEYLFYAFFVIFPFVNYSSFLYGGSSTRSLNLVIFAGFLGIALGIWLFRKSSSLSLVKSPLFIALALYFLALTLSGILGLDFSTTFWSVATRMTGLWHFLSLGFFMLLLFALMSDQGRQHRLILVVILSAALYSVLSIFGHDGYNLIGKQYVGGAFTFGNTTFAAMYLFGAFLLSLYYLFQSERKKWWMYLLPISIILNPIIFSKHVFFGDVWHGIMGDARATFYVILLSFLMLGALWLIAKIKGARKRAGASYGLFALGLVGAALATFSLLSHGGYLREAYLSQATAARPLVWEMSEKAIADRPILGWGADNFQRVFETHYDNRLLQGEYGNEAWFDRAHNVFIDQLVDNGFIGLILYFAVYIAAVLALIYTALHAGAKRDRIFAAILITYFTLHIAELQTAFDTSISYPMLAFMFVCAAVLYHRARGIKKPNLALELPRVARYALGVVLIGFFSWSLIFGALPFARAQIANGAIRKVGSAEKRMPLYPALFGSPVDEQEFLWRTVTDFERGIGSDPSVLEDPKTVENLKKELVIFETAYADYVRRNPTNFRAHLNFADVLIYQRLFEVNKLNEAQSVLDEAIKLVPQSPQPYWMKAVAYLYMKKFDLAREYAKKGLDLNPKVVQSQAVVQYINDSIKTFPEIDLFFFKQI